MQRRHHTVQGKRAWIPLCGYCGGAGAAATGDALEDTSKNSHRRRAAEFQPSSPCKNLDCPPGSLRLLQVKSD